MDHTPSFELMPAQRKDIPRLAQIHVITCLMDNAFRLYFPTAEEFEHQVTKMLEGQVGEPTWRHIKAVDKRTNTLVAWASWTTPDDTQIPEETQKTTMNAEGSSQEPGKGEFGFPQGLPMFVQEDTDRWLNTWTHKPRMICKALFTDPFFQRQGIGSDLVAYGNKQADEAKLPILLQASPYGYPIYAKQGFETVQHLDVDLTEWAPGAKTGDKGYGNYRFRYMLRRPNTPQLGI